MRKFLPEISVFVLIAFLNMLSACNYYTVKTVQTAPGDHSLVKEKLAKQKYFILHQGDQVWHMEGIKLDEDKQELYCTPGPLAKEHMYYKTTVTPGANRYKNKNGNPTIEVHIYISEYAELADSRIMIPMGAIQKIEVYDLAIGATTASYVLSTLGVLTGVCAILLVVILLTKSSCPFVYISDGVTWHFTGEMYGGAIYAPLERDDYMPLPGFEPLQNQFRLKISNELLERQYTDLAELMVIQHPLNSKVILDAKGEVHTLHMPHGPETATAGNDTDYKDQVSDIDSSCFIFNAEGSRKDDFNALTMTFKKPAEAATGKLVIQAKNSLWLDYTYGKFNELFGTAFGKFSENQQKAPVKQMQDWQLCQGIPLSVYIETNNGWQFVDYFNPVGPLASRDLVMAIDVSGIKGETLNVRLQCGFMFWEVDYAAMDFSENLPVSITKPVMISAMDQQGKDVSQSLSTIDKIYLIQPEVGNEAVITYSAATPAEGFTQTCFLHSRGYYEYIRKYENKPDVAYLKSFRQAGAFTRFSKDNYDRIVADKQFMVKALNE